MPNGYLHIFCTLEFLNAEMITIRIW